jgi:DNA replication protein DnaC
MDERDRQLSEERAREEEERRRRRQAQALWVIERDLGPRYSHGRCTLDNYQLLYERQRPVLAAVRAFADGLPEAVKAGRNLILAGTIGVGKDHLLAALLHLATGRHGFAARHFSGQALLSEFREAMKSGHDSEGQLLSKKVLGPDVLALSDPVLADSPPTPWERGKLFAAIDGRYTLLRPTWVTVNARDEGQLKGLLTPPVYDRLRENGLVLFCVWPSYRGRSAEG